MLILPQTIPASSFTAPFFTLNLNKLCHILIEEILHSWLVANLDNNVGFHPLHVHSLVETVAHQHSEHLNVAEAVRNAAGATTNVKVESFAWMKSTTIKR